MRRAFLEVLLRVAEDDDRIVFLTGDLGFQIFDEFRDKYKGRYVNVGVAEAQMVNCAAGLALEGWRPIVYSIASFMTARAFEQIKIALGYHELPVMVVGAGGGFTYGASGVTHHAQDDFGLMSLVPGMTVVAPGSPGEVLDLMPQLLKLSGPSYIRIGRYGEAEYEADMPAVVGKMRMLRDGRKVAVVTTGAQAVQALEAHEILSQEGIAPMVCQMHTVDPLDVEGLQELAFRVHTCILVEEHFATGGLGSAVASWRMGIDGPLRILRLGPDDNKVFGNPEQEELRTRFGYDAQSIASAVRAAWV